MVALTEISRETHKPKQAPRGKAFAKGVSPNPGGRPKRDPLLAKLARDHTQAGFDGLIELITDPNPSVRLGAIKELFNRGWGQAPATVILEGGIKLEADWSRTTPQERDVAARVYEKALGYDRNN